jgi:hypothetical protein
VLLPVATPWRIMMRLWTTRRQGFRSGGQQNRPLSGGPCFEQQLCCARRSNSSEQSRLLAGGGCSTDAASAAQACLSLFLRDVANRLLRTDHGRH